MEIFVLSFIVVSLAVLGMAVGALAGRRPITGGCGGVDCADATGIGCGACGPEAGSAHPLARGEGAARPVCPGTEGSSVSIERLGSS